MSDPDFARPPGHLSPGEVRVDDLDLADEVERLRECLRFADGLAVSETGRALADIYAADWKGQEVLARAGCWPRGAIGGRR
jgi:sugar lactone lactonase YvrE